MLRGLTASRNWTTSCGLSTTGSDCGFFGAGITSSKGHRFCSVTR